MPYLKKILLYAGIFLVLCPFLVLMAARPDTGLYQIISGGSSRFWMYAVFDTAGIALVVISLFIKRKK